MSAPVTSSAARKFTAVPGPATLKSVPAHRLSLAPANVRQVRNELAEIRNTAQLQPLGDHRVKRINPVLDRDGNELPVNGLTIHELTVCGFLLRQYASGYLASGAMVQWRPENVVDVNITLYGNHPDDCVLCFDMHDSDAKVLTPAAYFSQDPDNVVVVSVEHEAGDPMDTGSESEVGEDGDPISFGGNSKVDNRGDGMDIDEQSELGNSTGDAPSVSEPMVSERNIAFRTSTAQANAPTTQPQQTAFAPSTTQAPPTQFSSNTAAAADQLSSAMGSSWTPNQTVSGQSSSAQSSSTAASVGTGLVSAFGFRQPNQIATTQSSSAQAFATGRMPLRGAKRATPNT